MPLWTRGGLSAWRTRFADVKLIYATWDAAAPDRLRDEGLRARLAEAGATAVQLNLDDADVRPAMRLQTGAQPITALVSVWAESAEPTRVLGEWVDTLGGWEVEERRPLEPPALADGVRADALANVAVLRRPDELTREDWLHRWLVEHTPVALATQATSGYVQNVVVRPLTDDPPRQVDAVVEELFPSAGMTDVHAFYGSGGDEAELHDRLTRLMASVQRIGFDRDIDLVPSSRYRWDLTGGGA